MGDIHTMNVCVTVNSKYERYLYIMLSSLYEKHKKGSIRLFVIQHDFTNADKQDIKELSEQYKNLVVFIFADPHKFDDMPKSLTGRDNLSLEIFFRLLLPEYLPSDIDRVLMLDVDIVINQELTELYNLDFQECYLAAAPNMCHNNFVPEGWRVWYSKARTNWTHYNTGILLWNLQKIRHDFPKEFIFQQAWNYSIDIATYEEEIFNVVFGENGILRIPAEKYNYICTHEAMFEHPNFHIYQNNDEVKKNCAIVHYAALNPWQGGVKNEKFYLWWEICRGTKYFQDILEETYQATEKYLFEYRNLEKKRIEDEKRDLRKSLEETEYKLQCIDSLLNPEIRNHVLEILRKRRWKKVIIYGASRIAKCLTNVLYEGGIEIICYVDKFYQGIFEEKKCVGLEEAGKFVSQADGILVTVIGHENEIKKDLGRYLDIPRMYIDELLMLSDICFQEEYDKRYEGYFCPEPFESLFFYEYMADLCCPAWNNDISIGSPQEMTIDEIWNSSIAMKIRESILDGSYRYCNEQVCWRLLSKSLYKNETITNKTWRNIIDEHKIKMESGPKFLNIGYNQNCNLYCLMCREKPVLNTDQLSIVKAYKRLMEYDFSDVEKLTIPGGGELFIHDDYMKIIANAKEYFPNLKEIWLYSNGLLFDEKNWSKVAWLGENYEFKIFISLDAATKETYLKIRRGSNWERVMNHLKMLSEKRKNKKYHQLIFAFCVQKDNYKEMPDFVRMAKEIGADAVHFEKIFHSSAEFCVHQSEHPEYQGFRAALYDAVSCGAKLDIEVQAVPFSDLLNKKGIEAYDKYLIHGYQQ